MNFLFRLDLILWGPDVASTIEAYVQRPLKARLLTLGRNASAREPAVFMQKKLGRDGGLSAEVDCDRSVCCAWLWPSGQAFVCMQFWQHGVVMSKSQKWFQGGCIASISWRMTAGLF